MTDPTPYIRLWQSVCIQAVFDACYPNAHQREARMFIDSSLFANLCEAVDLSSAAIRSQMDTPGLFERAKKLGRRPIRGSYA
jgi:hypothetical protein